MEENQTITDPLQDLYNEFNPKLKLAKDYNEFKSVMQDPSNRKAFFDEFNPTLKLAKNYEEFDSVLGLKKKELSLPSGEISSLTQLPSEFTNVLKKGIETPKPSKEMVSSNLVIPTNLPKQEAANYERELKVNDAALNTLTDIYKQKGLKFDPSKPAAQKQIQEYIDKEKNNDLVRVIGKDGKEYLTRGQGFGEATIKTFGRSLKDPIESAQINFTNNPSELADLLDQKMAEEPNVPESAPSKFGGYLGGLVGGLPKMAALLSIPYAGESAMVIEMYHNAMANQRRELYQNGLQQGMTREQAAKKAMETAPVTAIPDAVLGYAMAKGVGTGGMKAAEQVGKNILPEAAKKSFVDAAGKLTKEVGAMSGLGFAGEVGRGLLTKQAGYNITNDEIIQKGLSGASEWGLMHAAFKLMHVAPKAISAAAKNLLSHVPEPILKAEAENYPDGQQTLQDVVKFANTKAKVADFVPENKVAAITGLTEKTDNLKKDIEVLEQNKKAVPPSVAVEIDNQIKDKNKEVDFYDNQIKKVISSKGETGIDEEVDDVTGKKLGTKTYIVDGKEVSKEEFEAMQGKPVGTKEIVKPSAEQEFKDVQEGNLVTFTYKSEDEVPDVFKDKITSSGETNGKKFVRVTIPKSLADYELSKTEQAKKVITPDVDLEAKTKGQPGKVGYVESAEDFYKDIAKRYLENDLDIVEVVDNLHGGKEMVQKIINGEVAKKTYQEVLKEKQEEEKKRNREIGAEKANRTKEIFRKLSQTDRQLGTDEVGAQEIALRYLADGGKVSEAAVNESYGSTKRAELNVGRKEVKTTEVKSRDYVGGKEKLDELAHRLWEENDQRVPEDLIKDALMSEIGNNNTRLDAAEAYLDNYNEDYKAEKYYARIAEEYEAEHLAAQEELEKELRSQLNEEIEGLSSEEHINNLIKQYESETKGENQQPVTKGEGEINKKISVGNGGEKAEIEEKGIEDVTRNEKRKIINSKFEELLTNEDFYNKFKIKSKCL